VCAEAGIEYAIVGDAYKPGDFLSCLRDAWMVALSVDERFRNPGRLVDDRSARAEGVPFETEMDSVPRSS
jgi:hypothetical protein